MISRFSEVFEKMRPSFLDNDAGTGKHGEGANPLQTFFRSSPRRPIVASLCQLNQRFPSEYKSQPQNVGTRENMCRL